jgi:glycosyltransferase involved in cell wall biosynthesis
MNKRVAFCINNLEIGGAEILLIDLINNWPKEFDIHLILLQNKKNLFVLLNSKREITNLVLEGESSIVSQIFKIRHYFVKNKIDFCFSHLERPNKICLIASILTKTKVIPVIHSINLYNSSPKLNKKFACYVYNVLASKIITISEPVRNYCTNELRIRKNKITLIENGIDFKRINSEFRNFEINDKVIFAVLGRMELVKGYDILLRALGNPKIKNLNWMLKMIGDGSELTNLKIIVNELDIQDRVMFLGSQKFPFTYMTDVNFIIMPSRREGLPISLLEALGFGIPVISSDIGVFTHFIKNGVNGYIFASEDEHMLANVISNCLNTPILEQQKMSIAAKKSVANNSIEICISKYLSMVLNLTSNGEET